MPNGQRLEMPQATVGIDRESMTVDVRPIVGHLEPPSLASDFETKRTYESMVCKCCGHLFGCFCIEHPHDNPDCHGYERIDMTQLYDHVWQPWQIKGGRCIVSADLLAGGETVKRLAANTPTTFIDAVRYSTLAPEEKAYWEGVCTEEGKNSPPQRYATILIDADLFARFDGPVMIRTHEGMPHEAVYPIHVGPHGLYARIEIDRSPPQPATLTDLRAAVLTGVVDQCPNLRFLAWTREPGEVWTRMPATKKGPHCPDECFEREIANYFHRPNFALAFRADSQQSLDAGMPAFIRCAPLVERLGLWLEVGEEIVTAYSAPDMLARIEKTTGVSIRPSLIRFVILSGHPTRPTPLAAVRSAIGQCRAAGVRVRVESLGRRILITYRELCEIRENVPAVDCKPGQLDVFELRNAEDANEWPDDCRVREDVWA